MTRKFAERLTAIGAVVLLACGLVAVVAGGADLGVPVPYATIQAAVDAAAPGDTVVVAPGTYTEDVTIDGKSGITITSSDPTTTTINGTITVKDSSDISIDGLGTISSPTGDGIVLDGSCSGINITNNTITGCHGSGIVFTPPGPYSDVTISDNDISNNGLDGIQATATIDGLNISGNTINNNGQNSNRGCGIRLGRRTSNVTIEDNTITGNPFAGIHPQ